MAGHRGGPQRGNKTPEATKDKTTDGTDTRRARPRRPKTRTGGKAGAHRHRSKHQAEDNTIFPQDVSFDGSWEGALVLSSVLESRRPALWPSALSLLGIQAFLLYGDLTFPHLGIQSLISASVSSSISGIRHLGRQQRDSRCLQMVQSNMDGGLSIPCRDSIGNRHQSSTPGTGQASQTISGAFLAAISAPRLYQSRDLRGYRRLPADKVGPMFVLHARRRSSTRSRR